MEHAGDEVEAVEGRGVAHHVVDLLVVGDRAPGRDRRVVPTVELDQLAAVIAKGAEVGVGRVDDGGHARRLDRRGLQVETHDVVPRIAIDEPAPEPAREPIDQRSVLLVGGGTGDPGGPSASLGLRAGDVAGVDETRLTAPGDDEAAVEGAGGGELGGREAAGGALPGRTGELARVEAAGERRGDVGPAAAVGQRGRLERLQLLRPEPCPGRGEGLLEEDAQREQA